MGLQATIQNLVGTAFDAIGDLKETVDYIHEGQEPDYDPTTGIVTSDSDTSTVQVRAVILAAGDATEEQLPTSLVEVARPGDQLALIPGVDMQTAPTTGDKVVKDDDSWLVKGMEADPAGGLWKVLLTRLGGGADGSLVFHE